MTGLSPSGPGAEGVSRDKLDWLVELERRGVVRIEMGCGPEYGALLRVIGARVGHAVAWSLLRTLARRRLESAAALDPGKGEGTSTGSDVLERVQRAGEGEALRVIPRDERVSSFFAPERTLLLMGESGALELCEHLTLKLAEGMLRPQPRAVDVLHFAHGPLQSLAHTPLSILYLAPGSRTPRGELRAQSPWLARLAKTLDPALHDLRAVHTELPMPFAVLELEAIFDAWILRHLDGDGTRPRRLARRRARGFALRSGSAARLAKSRTRGTPSAAIAPAVLERSVWPEVEGVSRGRPTHGDRGPRLDRAARPAPSPRDRPLDRRRPRARPRRTHLRRHRASGHPLRLRE